MELISAVVGGTERLFVLPTCFPFSGVWWVVCDRRWGVGPRMPRAVCGVYILCSRAG